ncbi:MAG: ABC transporter ATP-binding protein [Ilumatobacteraceae bacterium]
MTEGSVAAVELRDVHVQRGGHSIIGTISLRVEPHHRWVVLGANGSGKTTLLRTMALYDHPTSGDVEVLGERLGRADVRTLRRRVGYTSAALADQLRPGLSARDVVMTARYAALEPWWHRYTDDDEQRALDCLAELGVERFAARTFGTLSSGEKQRVLLARTLMNDPAVVLLDEPSAGLDLGGREQLVMTLDAFAADPGSPAMVLVTHHVDEIPPSLTHAMLLRDGDAIAHGPVDEVLTADSLSQCFGVSLQLQRRADGRFSAWAES